MSGNQFILWGVACIWFALAMLGLLVVRVLGWEKAFQYRGTLLLFVLALLSLPGGAVVKAGLSRKQRILSHFIRQESPSILLSGGCSIFPGNNIWNTRVDDLPLDAKSKAYVESMGSDLRLHGDFGPRSGIPYAAASPPESEVSFFDAPGESDSGPYRIPANAPIEDGGDRHVLAIDPNHCRLYELFLARRSASRWEASSGAIFDLRSNTLRSKGWTSADAAGLPVLAGLVRLDEVRSGRISHALRFTTRRTRNEFVWPARHRASRFTDPGLPPMGQRFRLRRSVDTSSFSPDARVILTALKEYGMILADNGASWFLTGAPDSRWSAGAIAELGRISGADFEAVDVSGLMVDPDSGEARRAR